MQQERVAVLQVLVHDPLGAIGYVWPIHWRHHVLNAHKAYEQLADIHEQVASTPPGEHRTRIIGDEDLIMSAMTAGPPWSAMQHEQCRI
jgi:hypothetical protein